MNLRDPKLWIGVMSAAAVLTFGIVDTARVSPGEVTVVHGRVGDLDGGQSCNACHGGWGTEMTDACLECHGPIALQLEEGRGLHGMLEEAQGGRCALCHSEHHGPEFNIVNALSFALAGVPDVSQFDHGSIGFDMSGAHLEQDCSDCHEYASSAPLPEGALRYLGLEQACATCHEDPHKGALGRSCTDCHEQGGFELHHLDKHADVLPLVGGHAELDCRACHEESTPFSLEAERHPRRKPEARSCTACHESPHAQRFAEKVAERTELSAGDSCVSCHLPGHTSFADPELTVTPVLHAASGFRLVEPHHEQDCSACHGEPGQPFAERFPGRRAQDCAACHEDPHAGQFDDSPLAPKGCVDCHAATHFDPHLFSADRHASTALPLDLSHGEAECSACHQAGHAGVTLFRGAPARCEDCHGDAHQGAFEPFMAGEPSLTEGECARCHDASSFDAVRPESFDHGRWTGFVLNGAHAQEACTACHTRAEQPDALGRRFGRIAERFGLEREPKEARACADCHADPHQGGFDGPPYPAEVEGRAGCVRCHGEESFRALPHGFDHGLWTGFPLDHAHAQADCASCHTPLRRKDAVGRTWSPALGASCQSCHVDPHGGQFERRGEVSCARCHKTAETFQPEAFDHQRTRFPLDEAHSQVACADCHKPELFNLEGGEQELVRFYPLGRDCVDCHGTQRGGALRRRRGK